MAPRLIVNADDYGLTRGVAAGIRAAHLGGIVTSTTAMMNMPEIEPALREAQAQCPHLGLGVHLVLTAGRPLLPEAQVGSLITGQGAFFRPAALAQRLSELDAGQLLAEWRTQIERFITATGAAPDHLDAHHHASYWTPLLLNAMLKLAREYGCAIRLPTGPAAEAVDMDLPAGLVQPLGEWAPPLLDGFRCRHPDYLDTSFYSSSATREWLLDLLAHLRPGTTELMCHPGRADDELLAGSGYGRQREVELAILTDPLVVAHVRQQCIELVSFACLR